MDKQLGMEATVAEYVAKMVEVFRLVREALAPWGTVWLNVGDTYAGGGGGNYGDGKSVKSQGGQQITNVLNRGGFGIAAGNLCLIPWRLAIALQDDGWIVRSVVVWHKPAPMPASLAGWRWARCRVKVKGQTSVGGKKHRHDGERGVHGKPSLSWGGNGAAVQAAQWADCPGCKRCEPHGGYVLRRGSWRATSSWEPVLMLAKGPGYYADGDAVRTELRPGKLESAPYPDNWHERHPGLKAGTGNMAPGGRMRSNPAGANLRDVWTADMGKADMLAELAKLPEDELRALLFPADGNPPDLHRIAAEPLQAKHYASFPSELVYRCLAAGTSQKGYCPACGMPWARVVETAYVDNPGHKWNSRGPATIDPATRTGPAFDDSRLPVSTTTGWKPTCNCIGADCLTPRAGLVLDPFCGSGRTGLQARRLGLDFVGCELSPEYCDLAEKLLRDDCPLFAE